MNEKECYRCGLMREVAIVSSGGQPLCCLCVQHEGMSGPTRVSIDVAGVIGSVKLPKKESSWFSGDPLNMSSWRVVSTGRGGGKTNQQDICARSGCGHLRADHWLGEHLACSTCYTGNLRFLKTTSCDSFVELDVDPTMCDSDNCSIAHSIDDPCPER
jgi:hypothetical protein